MGSILEKGEHRMTKDTAVEMCSYFWEDSQLTLEGFIS